MTIKELRNDIERRKGRRDQIEKDIEKARATIKEADRQIKWHEQAREILREVGLRTQQQLQYHISEITSLALEAVFSDTPNGPYSLVVEFIERRNKTECDLLFERKGSRVDPLSASGGGAVDVAAFALRTASWSMMQPKSRPVLILDEPFKCLKGEDANLKVLDMVKEVSQKLGMQIIMVSDERVNREDIIEKTDRAFLVDIDSKGISQITVLEKRE